MKRTGPPPRRTELARGKSPRRAARKGRLTAVDIERAKLWRAGARTQPCAICGRTLEERKIEGHHILPQQQIKRWARKNDVNPQRLLWDPRNRLSLCGGPQSCHARHEAAFARVPRTAIPTPAFAFAEELGPEMIAVLESLYPVSDREE